MNQDTAIFIRNITKTYKLYKNHSDRVKEVFHPFRKKFHNTFKAVDDISFEIKKGETVGIIGKNGSGKSTLLQMICGIILPSDGVVTKNGRISALLELGAGFNPDFTGRENVYLYGNILGLEKNDISSIFPLIEDFANIGEFIDQPVKTYSTGMFVRLAFAVASNVSPDILIIDEALAVGDIGFQAKCYSKFQDFQKKGVTILFVTHAMDVIIKYCNKAILLENGKLHCYGNPKNVVDEYNKLIVNNTIKDDIDTVETNSDNKLSYDNDWEKFFSRNIYENRYGDKKAEILEGGIFTTKGEPTQTLTQFSEYEFRIKVKFNYDLFQPIFAFTIKDIKGLDLTGTNTFYKNIDTGFVKKGEILLCTFRHRLVLNSGAFLLSFGCAGYESGNYIVYDRRYDYLTFEVVSPYRSVGVLDLDSKITIKNISK